MKHIPTITRLLAIMAVMALHINTNAMTLSPNGKVRWNETKGNDDKVNFSLEYIDNGRTMQVMAVTAFGLITKDGGGHGLTMRSTAERQHHDSYTMLSGKRLQCSNDANEVTYTFTDNLGREQMMDVRVYNDGIAFRYRLNNLLHTRVAEELTTYRLQEGMRRWMMKWSESYEDFFPVSSTGESKNRRWAYPALIQPADNVWALITEAGVERQNSAASLWNDRQPTDYRVVPDDNTQNVTGQWTSPWRVIIIGELKDVVQSTLVTDVCPDSRIKDTSWIRPGSVSWIYWAHNHGSKDFQLVRQYIDMAVEMKWPYALIDAEWDEMTNGGTIEDAVKYAIERGVRPMIWYNSSTAWLKAWGAPGPHERLNAPESREREFARLEKIGVAGVKIDFFAGDKQETMEYCIDLLECAARHHLMVNFHGATIPRGWQRTYPNLMSVEAVYGAEWYNNNAVLTDKAAAHNATLPFTRNVVGPMDYTPCTFSDSQHPHITTNAHELALPVLFESPLLQWADRPESYLAQPKEVKEFMSTLPTVWEETRLLSGYPGDHVIMARRSGNRWYIAGINGRDEAQTLLTNAAFLPKCQYTIYADGKPWRIKKGKGRIPEKIECKARGGFVIVCYI